MDDSGDSKDQKPERRNTKTKQKEQLPEINNIKSAEAEQTTEDGREKDNNKPMFYLSSLGYHDLNLGLKNSIARTNKAGQCLAHKDAWPNLAQRPTVKNNCGGRDGERREGCSELKDAPETFILTENDAAVTHVFQPRARTSVHAGSDQLRFEQKQMQ